VSSATGSRTTRSARLPAGPLPARVRFQPHAKREDYAVRWTDDPERTSGAGPNPAQQSAGSPSVYLGEVRP
jgi:hypothetical protein